LGIAHDPSNFLEVAARLGRSGSVMNFAGSTAGGLFGGPVARYRSPAMVKWDGLRPLPDPVIAPLLRALMSIRRHPGESSRC